MFSLKSFEPENRLNSIYGVIRPLYIGARIFGFFPFTVKIDLDEKNGIHFTIIDFVVFVTQIIIYSCFTCINIFYNLLENPVASPLLLLGIRIGFVFGLVNAIACLLADLWNRYQIFNIFNMYEDFDMQMESLGSTMNYKRSKEAIYVYFGAWVAICLIYYFITFWICLGLYKVDVLAVTFSGFFLSTSVFGILLSIYSFFLFSVRARFSLVNETLSRLAVKSRDMDVIVTSRKNLVENIMNLSELHDMLNVILEKVDRCYSIQAMLAFGINFTYMVFSLFSVYRGWIMSAQDGLKQFYLAVVMMLWSTFYLFFVITVLYAGHSTKNEGKFTGVLLHRAINKCYDSEVVERLLAFSHQIHHKIPDANCNLFSFDWTHMHSTVAATATYLIILIQFDASGYNTLQYEAKNMSSAN